MQMPAPPRRFLQPIYGSPRGSMLQTKQGRPPLLDPLCSHIGSSKNLNGSPRPARDALSKTRTDEDGSSLRVSETQGRDARRIRPPSSDRKRMSLSEAMAQNQTSREPSHRSLTADLADVNREDRALLDGTCKLPPIDACHQVGRRPAPPHMFHLGCRSSKAGATADERVQRLRAANALRCAPVPEPEAAKYPTRNVRLPGTGYSHTKARGRSTSSS
ncbi:hypothetical protein T484DRAFT_1927967 [Baffinella frigidus]|nr:hypothetical protein T484DRAFT_1927967 [Cryptophyta sp. CCMP2293]